MFSERTHERFVRWVDDTCNRPSDRDWLDYQPEIGLRYHRAKKSQIDDVDSVAVVPGRYLVTRIHPLSDSRDVQENGAFDGEEIDRITEAWENSHACQCPMDPSGYESRRPIGW